MDDEVRRLIRESIGVKQALLTEPYPGQLLGIAELIWTSLSRGCKLLVCGNGGSAADAQHTAAELVNRFKRDRKPLPAIALSTDSSILTSIGNDYSFEEIFSKQVQALGREGDVLLAISTSGRSKNILEAVRTARGMKLETVGFSGGARSPLDELARISFKVPSEDVARIQEAHIMAIHIICDLIERKACGV